MASRTRPEPSTADVAGRAIQKDLSGNHVRHSDGEALMLSQWYLRTFWSRNTIRGRHGQRLGVVRDLAGTASSLHFRFV